MYFLTPMFQIPENFQIGLTGHDYLKELEPLAHPCRFDVETRKKCTQPFLVTLL